MGMGRTLLRTQHLGRKATKCETVFYSDSTAELIPSGLLTYEQLR